MLLVPFRKYTFECEFVQLKTLIYIQRQTQNEMNVVINVGSYSEYINGIILLPSYLLVGLIIHQQKTQDKSCD